MKKTKAKTEERYDRIEKMIEALKRTSDPDRILELGQIEHDWMFANYQGSSPGTLISRDYIPAIDRAFAPSPGDELLPHECWQKVNGKLIKRHLVVQTLKPTKEEWDDRNNATKKSTASRINNKLALNPESLIEVAISMLDSDKWATIAAGLILLTGRRPTEIAWSGKLTPASEYSLLFSGQLKKSTIEDQTFEIPTLIPAEKVFQAYLKLRKIQRNKTLLKEIERASSATKKTNVPINRAVRQYLGNLIEAPSDRKGNKNQLSASNLRAAYGKIAAHFYCPPQIEPILFVAKILGHQTDNYEIESLGTTISYYTYRIVDREGRENNNLGIYRSRLFTTTEIATESRNTTESRETEIAKTQTKTVETTLSPDRTTETRNAALPLAIDEKNLVSNEIEMNINSQELETEETKQFPRSRATEQDPNPEQTRQQDLELEDEVGTKQENLEVEAETPIKDFSSTNNKIEDSGETELTNALIATELAKRLGRSSSTLGRTRKQKSPKAFALWSRERDPEGIPWLFLRTGTLPSAGHHYAVDIYVPIDSGAIDSLEDFPTEVTPLTSPQEKQAQLKPQTPRQNKKIPQPQLNRLNTIANLLDLQSDNPTEQLGHILDWVERKLAKELSATKTETKTETKAKKIESLNKNQLIGNKQDLTHKGSLFFKASPETADHDRSELTEACLTIAKFGADLHQSITPLTQQLKRAIDTLETNLPQKIIPISDFIENISQLPQADLEDLRDASDDDREIDPQESFDKQKPIAPADDRPEKTLNQTDIDSTIDALNTSIALKRAAIAKERKKRSKADNRAIKQWEQEIESIERSISFLNSRSTYY